MLDEKLSGQLKTYLERVTRPIEIVASLGDTPASAELRGLLEQIAGLSNQITLVERADDGERKPSFLISNPGVMTGVRFAGIPLGHEFTSLVLALLQVGGHPSKAAPELLEQIRGLQGEFHFETYFSLSCHNCPDVVQALNLMAVLNPGVTHTAIDGALFQDEVKERQIMAVPTVFLNGSSFGTGRMELEEILAKVDDKAVAREAEKLSAREKIPMTCWWWAAARPVLRLRCTPRARAFAPASPPSASAVRCWIRSASRTTSRSRKPKGRSSPSRSKSM